MPSSIASKLIASAAICGCMMVALSASCDTSAAQRERVVEQICRSHLKVVYGAMLEYRAQNAGHWPDRIESLRLVDAGDTPSGLLRCAAAPLYREGGSEIHETSFAVLSRNVNDASGVTSHPLVAEQEPLHRGAGLVLYSDGNVRMLPDAEIRALLKSGL